MARRRLVKFAFGSTVAGGGLGGAMYYHRLSQNKAFTAQDFNEAQDKERMRAVLRRLTSSRDTGLGLDMFRYTTCPYCGKVKAFLDYYGISHNVVEVEPMFKSQLSESKYKKLPQLRFGGTGGAYLVDSDIIVDTLAKYVGADAQLQDADVEKWRKWCRESLVRHITLNINTSLVEAWRGYAYIDEFDTIPAMNKIFLKVVGAPVMYLVAKYKTRKTLMKAGEIAEGEDERAVFHRQVEAYINESGITDNKPFHGGLKPDIADLDVYGALQSIRGHKVYDDLFCNTSVAPWLGRMDFQTGKSTYIPNMDNSHAAVTPAVA